jgi:ATP-dependent exoDNAse (exonuclease V) beta subunit
MNFVIYKASAGSGKTYTLANDYLSLALSSDVDAKYKNILAITFTNKAAYEMKHRVMEYLQNIGKENITEEKYVTILNIIHQKTNTPKEIIQKRANKALNHILHHYTDFNISTIDKFMVRVVKSFNVELKLPFNFEIEMDIDAIKREALEKLISKTGEDKELTAYLFNYIKDTVEEDSNWKFEDVVLKLYGKSEENEGKSYLNQLNQFSFEEFTQKRQYLREKINVYHNKSQEWLRKINKNYLDLNIDPNNLVQGRGTSGIYYALTKTILNEKFYKESIISSTSEKIINLEFKWTKNPAKTGDLDEILLPVRNEFIDYNRYKQQNLPLVNLYKQINASFFSLTLLTKLHQEILALKAEKNIVFLSEFNDKINEFVLHQPVPFIYEKIGERFEHYLIDEFQDTSTTQWQNLLPLVENSLSNNKKNIIVGDIKQAIYRWRGGDVDQFKSLPHNHYPSDNPIINLRYQSLQQHFDKNTAALTTNWRSLPNIIEFNNTILGYYIEQKPIELQHYYKDFIQQSNPQKNGGYVEVKFWDKKIDGDVTLDWIKITIEEALMRNYQYSDIAIITRKNKENKLVASYLTEIGIPIKSDESLSLNQSNEVVFVMNIYQLLFDKQNKNAIVAATDYLLEKNKQFNFVAHQEVLKNQNSFDHFKNFITKTFEIELPIFNAYSSYELIEEIIALFKINTNDPFIQFFLNVMIKKNKETAVDIIDWWKEKKSKIFIAIPDSFNAVNILTTHKSKGLEFDIVIIPFVDEITKLDYSKNAVWVNTTNYDCGIPCALINMNKSLIEDDFIPEIKEEILKIELDNLNLLYVALTRSAKELYIFGEAPGNSSENRILFDFIQNASVLQQTDALQIESHTLQFGSKNTLSSPALVHQNNDHLNVEDLLNTDWRTKVKISYTAPTIWNVPLNSSESFDLQDPRKYGNLIHEIFAKMDSEFNYLTVINEFKNNGLLDNETEMELLSIFEKANKNLDLIAIWKNPTHWIEREIIAPDYKQKKFRPDRIIFNENKSYILDFKTGEENDKDKKQILSYKNILNDIRKNPIQCFLYYTQYDKLIEVN